MKKTAKVKTEFQILTGFVEKIASMNMNQNVTLAAKMNAINATLMEKNVLKIAKMLKMGLEYYAAQSAMQKLSAMTVVMH